MKKKAAMCVPVIVSRSYLVARSRFDPLNGKFPYTITLHEQPRELETFAKLSALGKRFNIFVDRLEAIVGLSDELIITSHNFFTINLADGLPPSYLEIIDPLVCAAFASVYARRRLKSNAAPTPVTSSV